jgi:D-alanine-D-alanine ligase
MKKINLVLIIGGKNAEHEVSLQSGLSVFQALNKNKYNISIIGIDKNGNWSMLNKNNFLKNPQNPKTISLNLQDSRKIALSTDGGKTYIFDIKNGKRLDRVDIAFPVMHGTYAEDGAIQGYLEMMQIPYVGPKILGSAICMNKIIAKKLLEQAGLPVCKYFPIENINYLTPALINQIDEKLKFPLFVKPASQGSSVGVSKVNNKHDLESKIQKAFKYDSQVLVEEAVVGREIEVSVLGNTNLKASLPGEVKPSHEFYSYEAKYIDENGAELHVPAKLSSSEIKKVQDLAIKAFKTLQGQGMARVDFFLQKDGELIINELNTIPGFTKISMYPKLWQVSNLSYPKLLDKLIKLAMENN